MRNLIQEMVYSKYILNAANAQNLFKNFYKDFIEVLNELLTDIM
jgi:hypothetical protein